jgi:hypothetical protein
MILKGYRLTPCPAVKLQFPCKGRARMTEQRELSSLAGAVVGAADPGGFVVTDATGQSLTSRSSRNDHF